MEPAKIDWESIESVFVIDQAFENINAPQWFDFLLDSSLSPHPDDDDDDDAWFCRPDCKHPKTAEDFLKSTPTSKLLRSVSVSKLIGLGDWTRRRETNLKRRGLGQTATSSNADDHENQNPNFSTPVHQKIKPCKAAIKSSAQKEDGPEVEAEDEYSEILLRSEEDRPKLKSSQSARDLFGGRDLFGKITEFCNELKKMASRPKEREDDQEVANERSPCLKVEQKPLLGVKEEKGNAGRIVLGERKMKTTTVNEKDKERKPFLEVSKDRYEAATPKQKLRKNKRADEEENIPISLNLKEMKCKEEERLLPIRTNPPTPQGFSATRDPARTTPSKAPKSRLTEREILQDRDQRKTLREELGEKSNNKNASPMANKEGRALDVFWFLKPCTL